MVMPWLFFPALLKGCQLCAAWEIWLLPWASPFSSWHCLYAYFRSSGYFRWSFHSTLFWMKIGFAAYRRSWKPRLVHQTIHTLAGPFVQIGRIGNKAVSVLGRHFLSIFVGGIKSHTWNFMVKLPISLYIVNAYWLFSFAKSICCKEK